VASFTLNELPNDPSRRIATQMLFEMLDVGGYLVIIEAGNPMGSHTCRTARQFLLDTFNNVDQRGVSQARLGEATTFFDPVLPNKAQRQGAEEDEPLSREEALRLAKRQEEAAMLHTKVEMMLSPPSRGNYSYDQLGAYVIAPCTHDGACPLGSGAWCSFSQRVRTNAPHCWLNA
jgi:ribosomal protein RSM22 (predicted rRNA methylase)